MAGVRISRNQYLIILFLCVIIVFSIYIRSEYIREGGTALLRYDPYYHYRMAETILEEGHRPEWDYTASWPTGQPGDRHPPLYHYFLAYSFRLFGGIAHGDLLLWCTYSVALTVTGFIILGFFTGKELSDIRGGLFCALLFGLTPYIISRTILGFADTDGFIIIFSLLCSFLWIKSTSSTPKSWVYAMLAGFSMFLFELAWNGYWYIVPLLIGAEILVIFIQYIRKRKIQCIHLAVLLLGFFIPHELHSGNLIEGILSVIMAVILYFSYKMKKQQIISLIIIFFSLYLLFSENIMPIPFFNLNRHVESFVETGEIFYPYVGTFISQRKAVSGTMILQCFATLIITAPLGMVALLKRKTERSYSLLGFFFLYLAGGTYMILSGARFLLILSMPLVLLSSVAFSFILKTQFRDSPGRKTVVGICILMLLIPLYYSAEKMNDASTPISDDWMNAALWIQENTPSDCVVISDWGNGYWIESLAKRKSIMNGAHYDLYWRILKFGKMMETPEEDVAVKEVFGFANSEEALQVRNFPAEQGEELIEMEMTPFAVETQEAYLLLDSRNALTLPTITYYGTWDYTRGEGTSVLLYGGTPLGTMFRPHWKEYLFNIGDHVIGIYQTAEEPHSFIVEEDSTIPTMGTIYSPDGQPIFLQRDNGILGVAWYHSPSLMIFIPDESLDCLFVRLFFFNGDGLQHIELVGDFNTVKVFKIHRHSQQSLNEGIILKEDTWNPT
jgi:dolichyl-diphosphooligosaccharide--protein glycosyltransferase